MSEPYTNATGNAPENHMHANNCIHTFARADWLIVIEAAAGQPVRDQILRSSGAQWKFKLI